MYLFSGGWAAAVRPSLFVMRRVRNSANWGAFCKLVRGSGWTCLGVSGGRPNLQIGVGPPTLRLHITFTEIPTQHKRTIRGISGAGFSFARKLASANRRSRRMGSRPRSATLPKSSFDAELAWPQQSRTIIYGEADATPSGGSSDLRVWSRTRVVEP